MAITHVDVCNMALRRLGAERITSAQYTTPDSKRAQLLADSYELIKNRILESHPWNFAIKRATLVLTTAPAYGYTYAYTLPSDYLRMVLPEDGEVQELDFVIENGVLLTDEATLKITYVADVDEALFSPSFVKYLALEIAVELTYTLVQSSEFMEKLEAAVLRAGSDARFIDAVNGSPRYFIHNSWSDERGLIE